MKKILALIMALVLSLTSVTAFAETVPAGDRPGGQPPEGFSPGNMHGGQPPGGQSSQPECYAAVYEYSEDTALSESFCESSGTDENVIHVVSGTFTLIDAALIRTSQESTGGDNASFYGVGAALLVTGGIASISGSKITTDAAGGAGVFAYGEGTAYVSDTDITTEAGASGGIHVAGGGTLYAQDLNVSTGGASSAAIRSDRGGGTIVIDGGTYVSCGFGSPALYCTADITVNGAALAAAGSEALCLEGSNTVRLFDTGLSGNMPDFAQNSNTWTVILYQSMSGDAQIGKGRFEMTGGSLISQNGGFFYTTNTESEFILSGVDIEAADSEYFLCCTGNKNLRGWGASGANGADCTFTAIAQAMNGDIIWDSISQLDLYVTDGSVLTGAVLDDETCAGTGGDGYCSLFLDAGSAWVVTGDSALTTLSSQGNIVDSNGNTISIAGRDGTVYVKGTGLYTVTVSAYLNTCDLSGAGTASDWSDHDVHF